MIIRAYEGFQKPYGNDFLSMLQSEGEKLLSSVSPQLAPSVPTAIPQAPAPAPVVQSRALPTAPAPANPTNMQPLLMLAVAFIAYKLLFSKK